MSGRVEEETTDLSGRVLNDKREKEKKKHRAPSSLGSGDNRNGGLW